MKDIRILEEAMERAKDDEGKLALMDLIADNLTEFSVLVAVPGKEDLPIPGLPLFTREKFMEELPETKVQRMTLQEAFEEAICLPGCEGVVLNITNQPAPGMSIDGIHTRLVRWDRRKEDPAEVYEGLDKRMLIMRLLQSLNGAGREKVMLCIQELHLLCARIPAKEAEDCLDELVVFLETPERRWAEAVQKLNVILQRNGIREEDLALTYGGEEALQHLLEEKDYAGAVGWAAVHRTEKALAKKAAAALQAGRESGIPGASCLLGCFYETGWGVERDLLRARACYAKDAAAGNAQAIRRFATLLERGTKDSAPDPARAIALYQRGAELSADPGCLEKLGDAALAGRLSPLGEEDAFALYRRALKRTYEAPGTEDCRPGILLRVGICLLYGLGTGKNPDRALGYLRQAAGTYALRSRWDEASKEKAFWAELLCDEARHAVHPESKLLHKGDRIQVEESGTVYEGVVLEILEDGRLCRIRKDGEKKEMRFLPEGAISSVEGDRFEDHASLLRLPLTGVIEAEWETGFTAALYGSFSCAEGLLAGGGKDSRKLEEAVRSARAGWEERYPGIRESVPPAALAAPCGLLAASPEEAAALAAQMTAFWDMEEDRKQDAEAFAVFTCLAEEGKEPEEIRSDLAEHFPGFLEEEAHPEAIAIKAALDATSFPSAILHAVERDCEPGIAGLAAGALFPVPEGTAYDALLSVTDDVRQVLRHLEKALLEKLEKRQEIGQ